MRKIKEVLRLKFEVGFGLRQIARSCSIGLGTAHEYHQHAVPALRLSTIDHEGMRIIQNWTGSLQK